MIEKIGHYSITNPASVYDEEALTAIELAGRTAGKVNECVEHFNTLEKETDDHLKKQDATIPVEVKNTVQKHIDNGDFDEAINEYAGDLEARLDNILREGGDSTPELVDVRLGADGKTYPSAGESVRAQMVELSKGMTKENLVDVETLTAGFVQNTGEIYVSHQSGTFQRWEYTSDFIAVESDTAYHISFNHTQEREGWYAIATYDANKNFIDRGRTYDYTARTLTRKFTFPENVAYVRISYRSYMTDTVKFEKSPYATKHETIEVKNNLMDAYPLQFDGYIVENGSIFPQTSEGYIEGEPAMVERYTRHIPVKEGETYTLYHIAENFAWGAVGIYGADGKAIQRITVSDRKNTFTVPAGGVAIMVCARTYYLKDFALFKDVTPLTAEQRVYEQYIEDMTGDVSSVTFDENIKAINHRGWHVKAPENSLEAFKLSYENGFKYVECDVRFTSDGVPVLMHDATTDRTTDISVTVADTTLTALRMGSLSNGEKIPTFEEFINLCKCMGLHAYIEIKDGYESLFKKLDGIVRMYGMTESVSYISFNLDYLKTMQSINKRARLGYIGQSTSSSSVVLSVKELKTPSNEVFLDLASSAVNDDIIQTCAQQGVPLEVWTVNDETFVEEMLNPYITGVTSDTVNARDIARKTALGGEMTSIPNNLPTFDEDEGTGSKMYLHSLVGDGMRINFYSSQSTPYNKETLSQWVKKLYNDGVIDYQAGIPAQGYCNFTSAVVGLSTLSSSESAPMNILILTDMGGAIENGTTTMPDFTDRVVEV